MRKEVEEMIERVFYDNIIKYCYNIDGEIQVWCEDLYDLRIEIYKDETI